jgi:hypothetical protein
LWRYVLLLIRQRRITCANGPEYNTNTVFRAGYGFVRRSKLQVMMMIRRNVLWIVGAAALAVLAVPQMASAHVSVGIGFGVPVAPVYVAPAPVYYPPPPPVYYAPPPPPAYYAPAPVYYGPPAYGPAPVVVGAGWYRWGPRYRWYNGRYWGRWR